MFVPDSTSALARTKKKTQLPETRWRTLDNKSPTFVYLVAKELDCEEFDRTGILEFERI